MHDRQQDTLQSFILEHVRGSEPYYLDILLVEPLASPFIVPNLLRIVVS